MLKLNLFNALSGAIAIALVIGRFMVGRVERYIRGVGWAYMKRSLDLACLAQIGALVNVFVFSAGLNWVSVGNSVLRVASVICFLISIFKLEDMFQELFSRLKVLAASNGKE